MLLNPLPFPRAERIVTVWQFDATAVVERGVSPGNFLEWRDRSTAFDRIAAVEPSGVDLVSEGEPQNLRIWRVCEGFFDICRCGPLGVRRVGPPAGRNGQERQDDGYPNAFGRHSSLPTSLRPGGGWASRTRWGARLGLRPRHRNGMVKEAETRRERKTAAIRT